MFSDVSMLIITKDRQYMLPFIVHYHAQTAMPIFIADASETLSPHCEKFKNIDNVEYLHLPQAGFYERIALLVEKAKTPYCVLRADRRHQCNNAIGQCLQFLKQNDGYSSASGFWAEAQTLQLYYSNDILTEPWNFDDPVQRVACHALSFQAPFYNVQARELLQKRMDIMTDILKISQHVYYNEYIDYFTMFFTGKTQQLKIFGGLIQKMHNAYEYEGDFLGTATHFANDVLIEATYAILKKHLLGDNVSQDGLRTAFLRYIEYLRLRFLLYAFEKNPRPFKNVRRFGHVEGIISMLREQKPHNIPFLMNVLQVCISMQVDSSMFLHDIAHHFEQVDSDEFDAIVALIAQVQAMKGVEDVRMARKGKSS